jgi:hypothetical protein
VAPNQPATINPQQLCQVVKVICRTQPVQSQCARHKLALGPIPPEQHHLARNRKVLTLRQTYFVDNVTTSGHTLEAARLALGFGAGLVFADHGFSFQNFTFSKRGSALDPPGLAALAPPLSSPASSWPS